MRYHHLDDALRSLLRIGNSEVYFVNSSVTFAGAFGTEVHVVIIGSVGVVDSRLDFLQRLQRIMAEDNPFLPYFGPDVARPDSGQPPLTALADFQAARERLLVFLSALPPEAWDRSAVHETMGPTTLARMWILEHLQG